VKVFISSVTHLLKDEREALPPFLRVIEHVPLRFEDFQSQDRSSRQACIAGVEAADVYVLLLGPRYGEPFPDTGLSPTAEEYRAARNLGKPILVFAKTTDETDEPKQAEFKAEVSHYVNGRFWKSFTDPMSLTLAVGEALKEVRESAQPFRLRPLTGPVEVPWVSETGLQPPQVQSPVLELHVLPVGTTEITSATGLAAAAQILARDARASGFISNSDPIDASGDNQRAWAVRPAEAAHSRSGSGLGFTREAWRGLSVTADGSATAFLALPIDLFGAVVEQATLQQQIAQMIGLLTPHVGAADDIAFAVRLAPAEKIKEGNPAEVGTRNSGSMPSRSGLVIALSPDFQVSRRSIVTATGDVAAELTTRLLNDIRSLPQH
jgi:hypothetical protein